MNPSARIDAMLLREKHASRSAPNAHVCRECNGAGEFERQVAEDDFDRTACEACGGDGEIRFRAADPLEALQFARELSLGTRHAQVMRADYEAKRRRVYAPVTLPRDRAQLPMRNAA